MPEPKKFWTSHLNDPHGPRPCRQFCEWNHRQAHHRTCQGRRAASWSIVRRRIEEFTRALVRRLTRGSSKPPRSVALQMTGRVSSGLYSAASRTAQGCVMTHGARPGPDSEQFRSTPRTCGALPLHPDPALSWHSGFREGAHARRGTTPVHHAGRRRSRGMASRDARAQQVGMPAIGFLHSGMAAPFDTQLAAFHQGLKRAATSSARTWPSSIAGPRARSIVCLNWQLTWWAARSA
jgi:hypothetical protein